MCLMEKCEVDQMAADKDGSISGQDADGSRCDSSGVGSGWRQVANDNDRRVHRPDNNAMHRHRRTLARPLRAQRMQHRAASVLRTHGPVGVQPNDLVRASHREGGHRGLVARSFARAVRALRSPYLTNVGVFILLCAISFHPCFDLAEIVSRSFLCLGAKAAFVATVDLVVNDWTPTIQAFLAGRLVRWIGFSLLLALLPALTVIRTGMLARLRSLAAVVLVRLRRAVKPISEDSRETPGRGGSRTLLARRHKYAPTGSLLKKLH